MLWLSLTTPPVLRWNRAHRTFVFRFGIQCLWGILGHSGLVVVMGTSVAIMYSE